MYQYLPHIYLPHINSYIFAYQTNQYFVYMHAAKGSRLTGKMKYS